MEKIQLLRKIKRLIFEVSWMLDLPFEDRLLECRLELHNLINRAELPFNYYED